LVNTPTDPLIGSTVSHYEIIAKLGGGGMGVVYKARETRLGRIVALKFLPPQWSHDQSAKERFWREAQSASATNHPNICVIHTIDHTDDGRLFIVMAYYEGQTLKRKLEDGPLSLLDALDIACGVAEGLAKAHAQGVIHRDIKPGNLMVTEDGVKVLDFGLAKFHDALQLTIPGSTVGTVAYMSPEQARGEEADARSDVWALGVVLYEMLSGDVPFKGSHPEAVFYAIKNMPVPPLRVAGGESPAAVEALVLRALEKDPARRYQSAREMARDLRLLQGRTVPVDLLTSPIPAVVRPQTVPVAPPFWKSRRLAIAATLLAVLVGVAAWMTWPVARVRVAIAPVINQSGFPELDPYRMPLTHSLVAALGESRRIRVTPYDRQLQILRRFLQNGPDVSSREALATLATNARASFVVVPTIVRENDAWRARAEIRNSETATNVAVYTTDPVVSSLKKDTAYGLIASLATIVDDHFKSAGPMRAKAFDALRRLVGSGGALPAPKVRTLDAAQAFEAGIDAYDQLQFETARQAFERSSQIDARSPLVMAWLTRATQIVRRDEKARQTADQAAALVTPQTPPVERLFVAAVSSEASGDFAAAEARYRELIARDSDDAGWLLEVAAFQDRRTRTNEAIGTYLAALTKDDTLARPHLELCRLYNRLNESANAKQEGQRALAAYRALANRSGEAQASMCLTDRLRLGTVEERTDARRYAEAALKIFQDLKDGYNLARAYYYVALAAEMQGRPLEAMTLWEESLSQAGGAGNIVLQPLVLMNLGAMHAQTGSYTRALEYYKQSYEGFEALGDEQRAAQNRANAGVILAEFSDRPEDGLREIQNALGVFRKLDDKNFEVLAAKVTASFYRASGRHAEAEAELNRALSISRERDLKNNLAPLTADLGRSRFDRGDYTTARKWLSDALGDGLGKDSTVIRVHLGRVHTRLGDFETAGQHLARARQEIEEQSDRGSLSLLYLALGELAYESGRLRDARPHFTSAAALWTDDLPDPASVEAQASLGLLDFLGGRLERGASMVQKSLDQAHRTKQFPLETLCRLHLARIRIHEKRFEEALQALGAVPDDDGIVLGPEMQARVHHWRAVALAGRGDRVGAEQEETTARKFTEDLRASLPEPFRGRFESRTEIRLVTN
jgi:tetratricopeptide (TPR) repeat protein